MEDFTNITIDSLRVSLIGSQRLLLLKDVNSDKYLPLYLDNYASEAILLGLQDIEISRPQPHDLMQRIIDALGSRLYSIEIYDIADNNYYARLVLKNGDDITKIDCRPSDAIALAVRCKVPALVANSVLAEAGISHDEDINHGKQIDKSADDHNTDEPDLSAFESFFNSIDIDKED